MDIPDAKAVVDKEREKLEKLPAWPMTKVKSKREVIHEAQKGGKDSSFLSADGRLPPEELGNGAVVPKIQRTCCSPRGYCERQFWVLRCIYGARFVSVANDGHKSYACCCKATKMRRTGN